MAISFPRALPRLAALSQSFELQRIDYMAPEAGGRLGGITAGAPIWTMTLGLNSMTFADSDVWRAWVTAQRGAQRLFYGCDIDRAFPARYPGGFGGMMRAGGGAFTGAATSWSETIDGADNSVIALAGLPAGFILSVGDYIGLKWDAAGDAPGSHRRRALVRTVEAATANGSGALSVTCEPPVPAVVPVGAVAHLDNPACLMRLVTGDTQLAAQGITHTAAGGQMSAVQDLLP